MYHKMNDNQIKAKDRKELMDFQKKIQHEAMKLLMNSNYKIFSISAYPDREYNFTIGIRIEKIDDLIPKHIVVDGIGSIPIVQERCGSITTLEIDNSDLS